MNQNIEIALKQAFSLIEAGSPEDAKALLRPILENEKDNADVWWLYSHAVTDAETARLALNNVLRIEPNYPDARDLLNQLETQQKIEQTDDLLDMGKDPVFIPAMPSSVPGISPLLPRTEVSSKQGLDVSDELPEEMFGDEEPEPFYRRPMFYIPILGLLLIVALAIVIVKPFAVNSPASQNTPQSTSSSSLGTSTSEILSNAQPTATSILGAPTDINATSEAVSDISDVLSAFSEFQIPNNGGIRIADTNLGATLTVSVCTSAGKAMRELLPKAMQTLAKIATNYANQAQVVAVKMLDCTLNTTLLFIGTRTEDAIAFANGILSDKEFQAKWQPIK
jgi:hypothetical protein